MVIKQGRKTVSCNLKQYSRSTPAHRYGACKGMYQFSGLEFSDYEITEKYIPCQECKQCKRFMFTSRKGLLCCSLFIVFFLILAWAIGTPQGAVRRHLLITEGLHEAISAEIKKEENSSLRTWSNAVYLVTIDGVETPWQLWSMQYSCYGMPLEK